MKEITSRQELVAQLLGRGLLKEWGQGEAGSVDDFMRQIKAGEATAHVEDDGTIHRTVYGAVIFVYHTDDERCWKLVEDRQVLTSGGVRRRKLEASIAEKRHPGEDPEVAARRGLQEELSFSTEDAAAIVLKPLPAYTKGREKSQSYPGTITTYHIHAFQLTIPPHLFKPEGYVEVQPDKTTYFVWIKVANIPTIQT